jgi:hypothetical protein
MKRINPKISVILIICLMALNSAAVNAVDAAACLPHLCCSGPMEMGHHNGMINFATPNLGCCEDCDDIFCDLLKDPLKDVNAVNSSPVQGNYYPVILGTVVSNSDSRLGAAASQSRQPFIDFWASNPVPLYLEHLSLII